MSYATPSSLPATSWRQLAPVTLLVLAVHAVLLFGLPHLGRAVRAVADAGTFSTRRIAPPPAPVTAAPAAAPQPAPTPPRERPRPETRPRPAPAAKPVAAAEPERAAVAAPATPPATPEASAGAAETEATLLGSKPLVGFGGQSAPMPIEPPLAEADRAAALEVARAAGEAPVRVPRAAELHYQTQGTVGGQAFAVPTLLQWRQDGQWYEARWGFYTPQVGEQTWLASGAIAPQGLVPVRAQRRTPEAQTIDFDYARQRLSFSAGGADAPLAPGSEDRLSVLVQLGALLAGAPARYPPGAMIELPAARLAGRGSWRFRVESEEPLPGPGGQPVATVHLLHAPQDAQDVRVELWLGRTLDYLPVRMRVTEADGDVVESNLASAYAQPTPRAPARATTP